MKKQDVLDHIENVLEGEFTMDGGTILYKELDIELARVAHEILDAIERAGMIPSKRVGVDWEDSNVS